jgi:hypothetical protein
MSAEKDRRLFIAIPFGALDRRCELPPRTAQDSSHVPGGGQEVAVSAFTSPAPKNEVCPDDPPTQRERSSPGPSGCQFGGHAIGVAVRRAAEATADGDQLGWSWMISAATPVTCGAAIEVPLIHA